MKDICNFIPQENPGKNLQFIHFVYETGIKKLVQPFCHTFYCMHLVDKGSAIFKSGEIQATLQKGDLFFTFPGQIYTIEADNNFTYLYISFIGEDANSLLSNLGISKNNFRVQGLGHSLQFWMDSIIRVYPDNACLLTESVFLHTLSFISAPKNPSLAKEKIDFVLEYIHHNYATKDMSLKKVAGIFFYSEKYLSALFIKKTGVKFSHYINDLRIRHAKDLIKEGETNIAKLAEKCGFADQFYFSKVFKTATQLSPNQYIKNNRQP